MSSRDNKSLSYWDAIKDIAEHSRSGSIKQARTYFKNAVAYDDRYDKWEELYQDVRSRNVEYIERSYRFTEKLAVEHAIVRGYEYHQEAKTINVKAYSYYSRQHRKIIEVGAYSYDRPERTVTVGLHRRVTKYEEVVHKGTYEVEEYPDEFDFIILEVDYDEDEQA